MTVDLAALAKLASEATPGPWRARKWPAPRMVEVLAATKPPIISWSGFDDSNRTKTEHDANAAYIAAASPDVVAKLVRVALAAKATHLVKHGGSQMDADSCTSPTCRNLRAALAALDR
jgi:hypothetical protein